MGDARCCLIHDLMTASNSRSLDHVMLTIMLCKVGQDAPVREIATPLHPKAVGRLRACAKIGSY